MQKEPGVIAFYSAADIPGVNSFIPAPNIINLQNEELFCNGEVKYYNQPIGVIVAECQAIATLAAQLVKVEYANVRKPVIDIKEAKKDPKRNSLFVTNPATAAGADVTKVIIAEDTIYSQYAFTMETLACVTYPTEEGIKMHAATQWMDLVQQATSRVLKLEENRYLTFFFVYGDHNDTVVCLSNEGTNVGKKEKSVPGLLDFS